MTYRAFADSAWWNQSKSGWPLDAYSPSHYGAGQNSDHLRLTLSLSWSIPIYWAADGDPTYSVRGHSVRIPIGATPTSGSDHVLIVIDVSKGWCWNLWHAAFSSGTWTCGGMAGFALASDGLCTTAGNFGHRGFPPALQAIRLDEIKAGLIAHTVEVYWPSTASRHVFPMCGDEGHGGLLAEGALLQLKPSVDLTRVSGAARTIATCLRDYGAVVGDTGGGGSPNLVCERALYQSPQGLTANSLSTYKWSDYVIGALGFKPLKGGSHG